MTNQEIAYQIIASYAPYNNMRAFRQGMADYRNEERHTWEREVDQQAYDRGAEAQMRINREAGR